MLTVEERKRLDVAAKNYEEGVRRFYCGHPLEDRISDYVARYRAAFRLSIEHTKEKAKQEKG
jgi:hypothetical protein